MKTLQYIGPFSAGEIIEVPMETDRTYVHIGIQIPKRQPTASLFSASDLRPMVNIDDIDYVVNENGILEFDGMGELSHTIKFLRNDLPKESIIDIVYDMDKR